MAAITVTHNQDHQSPGVNISLSGMDSTASWTHFRVIRRDLSGGQPDAVVRGLDLQVQSSATGAGVDYEPSFLYHSYQYRLEMYINSTLDTTVTDTLGIFYPADDVMTDPTLQSMATAYLRSVNTPALSLAVIVADFRSYTRTGRILGNNNVLGRKNPVITTDVTSGRSGTLELLVGSFDTAQELGTQSEFDSLFDEGDVLLFQSVFSRATGIKDLFLVVSGIAVERQQFATPHVSGDLSGLSYYLDDDEYMSPVLKYSVDWIEVDRPATSDVGVTNTIYQDIIDEYATYAALLADNATYTEVLQGVNYPH